MILGIDFDNTLISYDQIMYEKALESGWIDESVMINKKAIRDTIRQLPDGEIKWQKLQAFVYGKGITKANLIPGVKDFVRSLRQDCIQISIVSHKTEFASKDEERINLRDSALQWMNANNFFNDDGLGLTTKDVFFESTRSDKINRIINLHCTHFIDDLEETFLEESFPETIEKILFAPGGNQTNLNHVKAFQSWDQIHDYFFAKHN